MAFTTPILKPLTNQESAANDGANWMAIVTADMLTQTATNTKQTLKLMDLQTGDFLARVWWRLKTAFQNTADNAFNSDTISIGDSAADTTVIGANQVNANGTVVKEAFASAAVGPYTAPDALNLVMNSMLAKALSSLNKGEVHVFIKLVRPAVLEQASAGRSIGTK